MVEICHNPLKSDCESSDIVVYIQVGTERFPICRQCWSELAASDVEWGEDGLKGFEENVALTQSGQTDTELKDEKNTIPPEDAQSVGSEVQGEVDAGRKFLEELARTMRPP